MMQFAILVRRGIGAFALLAAGALAASAQTPEAKLKALGIELPPAQKAVANYVGAVRTGNLVFLAGQGPLVDGKPTITGKVGSMIKHITPTAAVWKMPCSSGR